MTLYQLMMLLQGCDCYVQAMRGVTGGTQSSLGSGQVAGSQGKRKHHRVQEHSPAQIPDPCIPENKIQNAQLRFPIALHPGYSKERVLTVAKLPHSDPHLYPPVWTRSLRSCGYSIWTLSTSPFNFSSHIPVFLGWPVLDSKCSIYRWASWVCPRMLFGPPSMAAIWAPSMASWESRAAEEAWASASVKDERGE